MTARKPVRALAAAVGLAGAVLPLATTGIAQADESTPHQSTTERSTPDRSTPDRSTPDQSTTGYPSTQSPTQGNSAVLATAVSSIMDANNGQDHPDDADGTDTQYPQADPRFAEGPAGGLAKNGPFE